MRERLGREERKLLAQMGWQPLPKIEPPVPPKPVIRLRAEVKVKKLVTKYRKEHRHG